MTYTLDAKEFKQVYDAKFQSVLFSCLQFMRQLESAQDMATDSFLKLWKNRDKINNREHAENYVFSVSRQLCINLVIAERNRGKREARVAYLYDQLETYVPAPSKLTMDRMFEAIENLPRRQRRVLNMRIFEEMEYADIAKNLGISTASVRNRHSQALIGLRKTLDKPKYE